MVVECSCDCKGGEGGVSEQVSTQHLIGRRRGESSWPSVVLHNTVVVCTTDTTTGHFIFSFFGKHLTYVGNNSPPCNMVTLIDDH